MVTATRGMRALDEDRAVSGDPAAALRLQRQDVRERAAEVPAVDRPSFAVCVTARVLSSYWEALQESGDGALPLPDPFAPLPSYPLDRRARDLATGSGRLAAMLDPLEAGYQLGALYTALLPGDLRARFGVYYTPPALTTRLLTLATEAGVDWATCRALDPACGGGAFLTPAALRMVEALGTREPHRTLQAVHDRLCGFEIDPFGAWMSQVLLEAALLDVCRAAGRRLPPVVRVCDSLEQEPGGEGFDLVIGNPPYGRVPLSDGARARYGRSLFGHANLYGLFADLAVRWAREGGVIAYVTPTSFLGGEYFKRLRALLTADAPPASIDLIADRKGVFVDVLQETLLATYRRGGARRRVPVRVVAPTSETEATVEDAGTFEPPHGEGAWLIPRAASQASLIDRLRAMPHRLRDYGYRVSTGPLVWNRHKPQLRAGPAEGAYPLIWAEAVAADGRFVFRAEKRNHQPYVAPRALIDDWLVTRTPCVLVQRTTSKEQRRRLIAAELPPDFIRRHGAVVVENHVNMVRPAIAAPPVSTAVVAALLNSDIADEAFRCISGSVAVSASELEALPLPHPRAMARIEAMLRAGASRDALDDTFRHLYLHGGAWFVTEPAHILVLREGSGSVATRLSDLSH